MKALSGFLLLGGLTLLALVASLALALRARLSGRAEVVVATSMLWNFLIALPIYVLGLSHALAPTQLVMLSMATSGVALLGALRGRRPKELGRELRGAMFGIAMMPIDAVRTTWSRRSPAFLGVIVAIGFVPWTAVAAYLAPSWRSWDCLWYHEPIIGFTIQNRGFAPVDLPISLAKINGYPRLGEMTQLWFAIFTDRRLIDLPNTLLAPALMCSLYALCLRFSRNRAEAMGWGSCIVLIPACANLFQSTFVDAQNAAFVLAGIHFCTRPKILLRHLWLGAVCLTLATATKHLSVLPVTALALVAVVRLMRRRHELGAKRVVATLLGGASLIAGAAAVTFLRNWLNFHNPFWPDLKVDLPKLGIHWPGSLEWLDPEHRPGLGLEMNEPFPVLIEQLFSRPWSVVIWHFGEMIDYGIGTIWLVLPLGLLASVVCSAKWCWALVQRILERRPPSQAERMLANLMILVALLAIVIWTSPALWAPRYHIVTVALLMTTIAWIGGTRWWRLSQAALFATIVMSLMMFWWAQPRWWLSPSQAMALARVPFPSRELRPDLGAPVTLEGGLARERELGPGSLLVFSEFPFPSLLWNNHYSNRVVYMPPGPDYLDRADAAGASWVCCGATDCAPIEAAKGRWEEVGYIDVEHALRAFRRVSK